MKNSCAKGIIFLGLKCLLGLKVELERDRHFMKTNQIINSEKTIALSIHCNLEMKISIWNIFTIKIIRVFIYFPVHYISSQVFLATILFHIILQKWLFWYLIFRRTMLVSCFSGITFRGYKAENFIIKILTLWYIWNNVSLSYILVPRKSYRGKKKTNTGKSFNREKLQSPLNNPGLWLPKSMVAKVLHEMEYAVQWILYARLSESPATFKITKTPSNSLGKLRRAGVLPENSNSQQR